MNLSRREFLGSILATMSTAGIVRPTTTHADASQDVLSDPLLGFSPAERRRLAHLIEQGALDIAPVWSVPQSDPTSHLGWPVATQLPGGRIVLTHTRKDGHKGPEDLPGAGRHVIYTDDLIEWRPAEPSRIGPHDGMHCIGHARSKEGSTDRVLIITSEKPRRVYVSDDAGVTWRVRGDPFDATLDDAVHVGPNLVEHPAFGIVAAFGQQVRTGRGGRNFIVRSLDAGEMWDVHEWRNEAPARSVEPALAVWGPGHLVMISREFNEGFAVGDDGRYAHTQHVYRHRDGQPFDRVTFDTLRTNIVGNPADGHNCHDTAEVIFNPVTGRIETLHSHRLGGGPGRTGRTVDAPEAERCNTLNLWSIDPDELLAGESTWRFDGTVIERTGYSRRGDRDGLHPGGSVIDRERGLQHIFIYAGWRRSPASLYRISRTLDTERWRAAVRAL